MRIELLLLLNWAGSLPPAGSEDEMILTNSLSSLANLMEQAPKVQRLKNTKTKVTLPEEPTAEPDAEPTALMMSSSAPTCGAALNTWTCCDSADCRLCDYGEGFMMMSRIIGSPLVDVHKSPLSFTGYECLPKGTACTQSKVENLIKMAAMLTGKNLTALSNIMKAQGFLREKFYEPGKCPDDIGKMPAIPPQPPLYTGVSAHIAVPGLALLLGAAAL